MGKLYWNSKPENLRLLYRSNKTAASGHHNIFPVHSEQAPEQQFKHINKSQMCVSDIQEEKVPTAGVF